MGLIEHMLLGFVQQRLLDRCFNILITYSRAKQLSQTDGVFIAQAK